MATLKNKDIKKMTEKERNDNFKDLRMELIKNKTNKKGKIKPKELKKAMARILTFNRLNQQSIDNK